MRSKSLVLLAVVLTACGPLKNPFDSLPPGTCTTDDDCAIAACPNACNQGQPFCQYPKVHATTDLVKACPCFGMAASGACAAPAPDACGPQPGCAGPRDADQVRARCVAGACAARFADGGTVSTP